MRTGIFVGRLLVLWCLAALLPGCVESYLPDVISTSKSYLVVNGFINSRGTTTISLSRTYDLASTSAPPAETGATVYIEEEAGPRYPLRETSKGTYTSGPNTLSPGKNYRLRILTAARQEYASAYVPVKNPPPIDNLAWKAAGAGLEIGVNSHDDTGLTQYYRWEYEETWEIAPVIFPTIEYASPEIIRPITTFYPLRCWGSAASTSIIMGKTTALSQDVVSNYVVRSLPTTSERLRHKYSILVKQYAQTKEEYTYWEQLKKNSENIGTLFDPLPSQLTGNMQCLTDPAELALGFVGATSVEEKRIFISRSELPVSWLLRTGYEDCFPPDTVYPSRFQNFRLGDVFGGRFVIPVSTVFTPKDGTGYISSTTDCVDCRKRGTAVRPAFWQ